MPSSHLPERASLEYLRKLAKERLRELRKTDPAAKLADAQLTIAREHGFSSWRALKTELDRRAAADIEAFFAACVAGDTQAMREALQRDPELVKARNRDGATPLHAALRHSVAVQLLLEHGADPNARDVGDNALPLHFAAGGAPIETIRALLDAGSDAHGSGDDHGFDVIGWATCFAEARRDVVDLLLERGAHHNIFSAVALNDLDAVRNVVERDPSEIARRLPNNAVRQTALHYVIAPPDGLVGGLFRTGEHYRTLELLVELGADLEAMDAKGRTPLAVAMLRGDLEAMRILHAAGAREPHPPEKAAPPSLGSLRKFVGRITPMLEVPDIDATLKWYQAIGFELAGSHAEEGRIDWASVKLGETEIMFVPSSDESRNNSTRLSLWIHTERIDDVYAVLKRRQLDRAHAVLAGAPSDLPEVRFTADLYNAFYGQREFCIVDPNGIELSFYQPLE